MKYSFNELAALFDAVPDRAPAEVAACIHAHRRIFVYGAGRSGLALKAFAMRLAQAGHTVYVVGETITPALEKDDLLILASASGQTPIVLQYAQTAAKIGAEIFAVTTAKDTPLAELCDKKLLLPAPTKNCVTKSIMGTLFEQALLLFFDLVVTELKDDAVKMRACHANLE